MGFQTDTRSLIGCHQPKFDWFRASSQKHQFETPPKMKQPRIAMIITELKLAVVAPKSSNSSQSAISQYFDFKSQGHSSGQYIRGSCSISGIGHFVSRRHDSSPDR